MTLGEKVYKLKIERGLPLVHVHLGIRPVRAKGGIAIANVAGYWHIFT